MANITFNCDWSRDDKFGPGVQCAQFDFTLIFEQTIFGIGISSLFSILAILRFCYLFRLPVRVSKSRIYAAKLVVAGVIVIIDIALLGLWTKHPITRASIASATIQLFSMLTIVALELVEHTKALRPSPIILLYLLSSVVADCLLIRTLFLRHYVKQIAGLVTANMSLKLVFLVLENLSKKKYFKIQDSELSPEETIGIIEKAFFWWINSLLLTGRKKILTIKDLYPLDPGIESKRLQEDIMNRWPKHKGKSKYSFLLTLLSTLRRSYMLTVIPRLSAIGFNFAQTFLINDSVTYLDTPPSERNKNHAYGLIGAGALIYGGLAISTAAYNYANYRVVTIFRGATAAIIYEKSLHTSADYDEMKALTLMSTDVDRIVMALPLITEVWANCLQVGIGIGLLWRQLGAVAIAPIIVSVMCFGMQTQLAKVLPEKTKIWVEAIQRRVGLTTTTLQLMKSIKLAGLSESMIKLLQSERIREVNLGVGVRKYMCIMNIIANFPIVLSSLTTFAAFVISAKVHHKPSLTTAQAFTSLSLLQILIVPAALLLFAFPQVAQSLSCVSRIQKFLEAERHDDPRLIIADDHHDEKLSNEDDSNIINAKDLKLPYVKGKSEDTVLNFDIVKGSITVVIGVVGCGKSTLLKVLLGEQTPQAGSMSIRTPFMGFCAQSPWIQNKTIRENIIGPSELDKVWFRQVLHLCDLEADVNLMPNREETLVGSRGIVLSGGQKHRIALARVLYSRCPVLLLDDFFSSLDRKTRRIIMERLFSAEGYLRKSRITAVLATHTTSCAQYADNILVLKEGGSQLYWGSPSGWHYQVDEDEQDEEDKETTSTDKAKIFDSKGAMKATLSKEPNNKSTQIKIDSQSDVDPKRQTGDGTIWWYYAKSLSVRGTIISFIFATLSIVSDEFPRILIKINTGPEGLPVGQFVGVYTFLVGFNILSQGFVICFVLLTLVPNSARRLHYTLLTTAFRAPMQYFTRTDVGVLVNRFSQDMTLLDQALPSQSFGFFLSAIRCIVNAILVCLGSSYMAATIPVLLIAAYFIQKYYLLTSRQIRLLDLEAKSPLYTLFTETADGVSVIRGLGWQRQFNDEAIARLNDSQKPFYMLFVIQRWLTLVIDLTAGTMGIIVLTLALCIPSSTDSGLLGVALTSILSFNLALTQTIFSWTNAETSIGSVTRTRSFARDTPSELSDKDVEPEAAWPVGNINVENLSVVFEDETTALKDVSFDIKSGKKFGICGRSGSGKSTLISTLLRIEDPTAGTIKIDHTELNTLTRSTVRERIICLPQDAMLFPRSFQFNLDPGGDVPVGEEKIFEYALRLAGLWDLVDKRGGLSGEVEPQSLSHGEKQLLALARAVIRRKLLNGQCILVLDEATSGLDDDTQAKFQEIIDTEFKPNTVISVAHRLETLRNFDEILVLHKGRVEKIGSPTEVL